MKYRAKPIVIDAFQITKASRVNNENWPGWLHEAWNLPQAAPGSLWPRDYPTSNGMEPLRMRDSNGGAIHDLGWGDWIIKEGQGQLRYCEAAFFSATYEAEPVV